MNADFQKALTFLHSIGIATAFCSLPAERCFLPGLLIEAGRILIDEEKLLCAGDVLHEAGHLAVVPATERAMLDGPAIGGRKEAPAEEMMAIAWSYAACVHLQIDPAFVFHDQGYKGGGAELAQNFKEGRTFGVPLLIWLGMTGTSGDGGGYPLMTKWLRD
jgi:hypothetical protein